MQYNHSFIYQQGPEALSNKETEGMFLQIFKLSQGEYVAPERVEGVYKTSSLISQLFVYAAPTASYLVGVAVPEEAEFMSAIHKAGFRGGFQELIGQSIVKNWLLNELSNQAEQGKLRVCLLHFPRTQPYFQASIALPC